MSNKNNFQFKTNASIDDVATYLTSIINSFKSNRISLKSKAKSISLTPPEFLDFEVEAEQKKNKEKISIEISWKLSTETEEPDELEINSEELPEENKN